MSKQKIDWNLDSSPKNSKRLCNSIADRTRVEPSESVLWPETEESFFSNSKIGNLLKTNQSLVCGTFRNSSSDDSLFSEINLPEISEDNVTATPLILPIDNETKAEWHDTFFSEINVNCLSQKEEDDLFGGEIPVPLDNLQNTQKFLSDVAFKVPSVPLQQNKEHIVDTLISAHVQAEGIVLGTQYKTREEIQNHTEVPINQTLQQTVARLELSDLTHLNWETQAFPEVDTFPSKGNFYGLPDRVRRLICEHKGIKNLYEWQDECLNLPAIRMRKNLIYALPTSGGKTLVAEILMLREIICRKKNVLFVLPYVSIVQEKVSSMSPFAITLDFIVDEYTAGKGKCPPIARHKRKSLFIASIEKGAVLLDSLIDAGRVNEIGLVVIDELHLIGEKGRGATLEALLTKVMFVNANIQIVGMSATIGNLSEISSFLKADVYTRGFRPVELKEYVKCGNDILEINTAGKTLEEVFVYKRSVNFKYSASVLRVDPDHLAGLVTECAPENCCLVFCSTRKSCENVALLLARILPKAKFIDHRKKEKNDLMDALDKVCGILSPVLAKTIPFGIAYHHSGLTTDERKFIETAYRFGVISIICCTSTLAAGVNLPAKRVIIRAPYVGSEFITLCKYKQMVGRAGRAGMGEAGESFLISASRDNVRVGEMLFSPMDRAISSLDYQEGVGLQSLILSSIGLDLARCRSDLSRLINSSLMAVQAVNLGIATEDLVLDIVRAMFKNKILQICNDGGQNKKNHCVEIVTTQDKNNTMRERCLLITRSTRFQLTTIGRAAFKAGIDYKRTYAMYYELKEAQANLILSNYAHMLYLVIAFNSNANGDELFAADAALLFRLYSTLDETTQKLFKQLGITEAHAAKLAKTLSLAGSLQLKLNRLFKVLILKDILDVMPIPAVAAKFNIERGMLQHLISQSTAAASAIVRLCEQVEEFWCFKPLFERVSAKMDRCGTIELEPLLELPGVKMNRAKQLYAAGYKTIEDIAKCRPMVLVKSIEHMPLKIATEIISAAKIILMKKLDHLEEETEALKICLVQNENSQ